MLATTLATLLLCPAPADPFEHALSTDRPDIAETSLVVEPAQYQIEQGFQVSRADSGTLTWRMPELHRIGLLPGWEARLETDGLASDGQKIGLSDLSIGFKWHFLDGDGLPSLALLVDSTVPSAINLSPARGWEPAAKVLMDVSLPADFELGVNLGAGAVVNAQGQYQVSPLYVAALAYGFHPQFRGYAEVSGDSDVPLLVDGGVAFLITPDWQLDASVGRGLIGSSLEWSGGVGVSARF